MKYVRKDVIGQVEEFEGDPIEIIELIKLLDMKNDNSVFLYMDQEGYHGVALDSEDIIYGDIDEEDDYDIE